MNNEFYVFPVYNEAIEDGKIIKPWVVNKIWDVGTPEQLASYIENVQAKASSQLNVVETT